MGLIIACVMFFLLDLYAFKGISLVIADWSRTSQIIVTSSYWTVAISLIVLLAYTMANFTELRTNNGSFIMWVMGVFSTIMAPILIFSLFHLVDDAVNLFGWGINKMSETPDPYSRRKFITQLGLGVGGFLVGAFGYGVTKGKFAFRILRHDIVSSRIPKAFDGAKIVQISDAHLGSFMGDTQPVQKMVDLINGIDADYVFFTGDMVNSLSEEAEPWIDTFAQIKAKGGKFSIFGNHDYADYGNYTRQQKIDSQKRLKEIQQEMGFRLLEDENLQLEKNGEKITLIGVHNWGKGFHQVGDLQQAIKGVNPDDFKILLSHDPTHWEEQVVGKEDIDLTLSGHTHGMQFGIEIPFLNVKWSPVQMRYKRWGGLYTEGSQHIHINRGLGVLGFPGRVGMPPEITLLELKSA